MSDQREERLKSLEFLRQVGINPYAPGCWNINTTVAQIKKYYNLSKIDYKDVSIAGRVVAKRIMGGSSFGEIQDHTGRIQFYIKRGEAVSTQHSSFYDEVFKKHIDLGDIIGIKGYVFTTKSGEITIGIKEISLLSKAIRPIPAIKEKNDKRWTEFSDVEKRYRMRYLDLILNDEVREIFFLRSKIIQTIREELLKEGLYEVETPVLQPIYGGANASPFTTYVNALDATFYLRIANELYLKRLIIGGFPGVFEFSRNFRNEGIDKTHHPEFSMLEAYFPYKDYYWLMDFTETLLSNVVLKVKNSLKITWQGYEIDFSTPWRRISFCEAVKQKTGIDVLTESAEEMAKLLKEKTGIDFSHTQRHILIDKIFSTFCQKEFINPTIVYDYPVELSPLALNHRNNPRLTERFELIIGGMEICNAFTELNDPIEQKVRFLKQMEYRTKGDIEAMPIDYDFIRAMEYGMPPTAGIGIGIDRLVMLLTNAPSIQETILFPLMAPENFQKEAALQNIPLVNEKPTQ